MLVAIEDVVDEPVDYRRLAHRLVPQEHDLVLQQRGNRPLRQVQVADVRSHLQIITNSKQETATHTQQSRCQLPHLGTEGRQMWVRRLTAEKDMTSRKQKDREGEREGGKGGGKGGGKDSLTLLFISLAYCWNDTSFDVTSLECIEVPAAMK